MTVVHIFRYDRAIRLTHTSGRNQKRENDLRFSVNAANRSTRGCKNTTHDSTNLVVTSRTIVRPGPRTKHSFCQFLQILYHPRKGLFANEVVLTSISTKFNALRGCGSAALAFAMRFSSAVGSRTVRGTVVGSMGPMHTECGSVLRASGGCICKNSLLHIRNLHQYVQRCVDGICPRRVLPRVFE
jgi:hypothetical protein